MKGTAKSEVVTSGRLTGGVKGQLSRRRVTPDPGPACPEPAYSLYSTSTDPEEQVSSLHKGLDRCAALLTDILQADKAGFPRAVKGVAAKSTLCSALEKKIIRNTKTGQRGHQPVQPVPGTTTHPPAVKLHPPEKQTSIHPPQTSIHPPEKQTSIHPLQTSIHPPDKQTSIHPPQTSIHPPEKQTSIHPPEKQTSIHPPQISIHPPEKQSSIHPPQPQSPIHPPQTSIHPPQTSIHPPQTSIHPPQTSIHPPQTSIHPPQTSIHPPQTSIHPPQTSIHPPQTSIHPPQTSIHPPQPQFPIHPPQTYIHPPQTSIHPPQTSIHPPQTSIHPPQTSIHPPQPQSPIHPPQTYIHPPQTSIHPPQPPIHPPQPSISYTYCKAECDKEEEEFVPVRDINDQSSAIRQMCTLKMSNMQPELGQVDKVPQDSHSREDCSAETDVKVKTVQYLLGELKALIAGQGSVAERLLSHLEQTVFSPLMGAGSSNIRTEPELLSLHSQNTQLRRRVRILNQQLKQSGRGDTHQNLEMLCYSEVLTLQEELSTAQSRLQEVQEDLTELRKALEDTESRLTDREAENALIQTDLEATRSRLLDSEREKSELASLAQQSLEDIGNLNRILQGHDSSNRPSVVDSSVSDTEQHFKPHRPDPAEAPTDRITQFLMSLGQLEPTPTEHVCVAAEQEQKTLRDTLAQPDVRPGDSARHHMAHLDPSHCLQEVQSCGKEGRHLSRFDVESVWSDWSATSGSTFDTKDEVAFRDGLAALDASIASLQKTIQLDLGR